MKNFRNGRFQRTPVIGVLKVPNNQEYTDLSREKIECQPLFPGTMTIELDCSRLMLDACDERKPIAELEKKYKEDLDRIVKNYLGQIDGMLLLGDRFDVPPELFGQEKHPETSISPDPRRTLFVRALIRHSKEIQITPGLGICGSMQQYSVLDGATMVQHVPDVTDGTIDHRQRERAHEIIHPVDVYRTKHTGAFYGIVNPLARGETTDPLTIDTNSIHHQAVCARDLPSTLQLVGMAKDGTVEAVEAINLPWILVQFHPELLKRLDRNGERTLSDIDYRYNHYGDGRDMDYEGNILPDDPAYYANQRIIADLITKAHTHCNKRISMEALEKLSHDAEIRSEGFTPSWVARNSNPSFALERQFSGIHISNKEKSSIAGSWTSALDNQHLTPDITSCVQKG